MTNRPIDASVAAYRALLHLYPTEHRDQYGPHMLQVFRDCCRDAYHQRYTLGLLDLWLTTILDLTKTALEERTRRGTTMNREAIIRASGLAAALGGGLWAWLILTINQRPAGGVYGYRNLDDLGVMFVVTLALFALGVAGQAVVHYSKSTRWLALLAAAACFTGLTLFTLFSLKLLPSWTFMMIAVYAMVLSYFAVGVTSASRTEGNSTRAAGMLLIVASVAVLLFNTEDARVLLGLPLAAAWLFHGLTRMTGTSHGRPVTG